MSTRVTIIVEAMSGDNLLLGLDTISLIDKLLWSKADWSAEYVH